MVRAGFLARGLTYGITGVLAIALAAGAGGSATNQQGALELVARAPLGKLAVIVVAAGLAAYALWKFALAALGTGPEGGGGDGAGQRVRNLAGGVAYIGLLVVAIGVLTGSGSSQSAQTKRTTAGVLGWPGGPELVAAAGALLVVVCAVQAWEALQGKFMQNNKVAQLSRRGRTAFGGVGRFGLTARAAVFTIIGLFLIKSAVEFNPTQAVSLDGALRHTAAQPYGSVLLGLIALGLIAFAAFSFTEARLRRL